VPDDRPVTIAMIADVAAEGVAAFRRYESLVLPLLDRHDGRLERRLRSADGLVEIHVVSFASPAGYESYMADPERVRHRDLLAGVDLHQRILDVHDVEDLSSSSGADAGGT
jgi:hypothetical protein